VNDQSHVLVALEVCREEVREGARTIADLQDDRKKYMEQTESMASLAGAYHEELTLAKQEVERLTETKESALFQLEQCQDARDQAQLEVERLESRVRNADAARDHNAQVAIDTGKELTKARAEVKTLRSAVERLRVALENLKPVLKEAGYEWCHGIIQEALILTDVEDITDTGGEGMRHCIICAMNQPIEIRLCNDHKDKLTEQHHTYLAALDEGEGE